MPQETSDDKKAEKKASFRARLVSTLVLWFLVLGVFVSGNAVAVAATIALITILALWEWSRLWSSKADRGCLLAMVSVGTLYLIWEIISIAQDNGPAEGGEWTALIIGVVVIFTVRLRKGIDGIEAVTSVAVSLLGLVFLGLLLGGGLIKLSQLETPRGGQWFMLLVVATTKFTDMGAYLVGSAIGRNKMIPHISPGKTWEGFFGALLVSQIAVWLVRWGAGEHLAWAPQGIWLVLLGLILAVGAVVGDLAESLLKRSLAAKDSGQVLPGIGGVLDLVDSICFTAPLAWVYLRFFGIG